MRDKWFITGFIMVLLFFMISYFVLPDKTVSLSEKRAMTTLKDVRHYSITDPFFSQELEKYALDQVNFRDQWRYLKAKVTFDILNKADNNGYYMNEKHLFKKDDKIKEDKLFDFVSKTNDIISQYPLSKTHMMIIPSKENYSSNPSFFDMNRGEQILKDNFNGQYLSVNDKLALDDYYASDPHLKQDSYFKLLPYLNESGLSVIPDLKYQKNSYYPFYGTYKAHMAYQKVGDELNYYENEYINKAIVNYLDNDNKQTIYDEEALTSQDAYNLFLGGPTSFVEINNSMTTNNQTLLIFRDSFGSSLTPLLMADYQTIYVVDLRYITFKQVQTLIDKEVDDILFIYGMMTINQGVVIK